MDDPEVDRDVSERYTYRGKPYTGEAVEYGPSGQIVTLWTLEDGVEDGPQKTWNADGSPDSEGTSRRGRAVGEWREWYPNGQLKAIRVFDEQGNHVLTQEWTPDGTPVERPRHSSRPPN